MKRGPSNANQDGVRSGVGFIPADKPQPMTAEQKNSAEAWLHGIGAALRTGGHPIVLGFRYCRGGGLVAVLDRCARGHRITKKRQTCRVCAAEGDKKRRSRKRRRSRR